MATTNKKAVEAVAPAQGKTAKKYTVEKLQANCRQLFGVSTSTFAGATYGITGDYTVEEMQAHIEAWKKKGAK
ncbi:MAG: hypothetical protein K1W37_04240 [Lachnospiraceae bacterium]